MKIFRNFKKIQVCHKLPQNSALDIHKTNNLKLNAFNQANVKIINAYHIERDHMLH